MQGWENVPVREGLQRDIKMKATIHFFTPVMRAKILGLVEGDVGEGIRLRRWLQVLCEKNCDSAKVTPPLWSQLYHRKAAVAKNYREQRLTILQDKEVQYAWNKLVCKTCCLATSENKRVCRCSEWLASPWLHLTDPTDLCPWIVCLLRVFVGLAQWIVQMGTPERHPWCCSHLYT